MQYLHNPTLSGGTRLHTDSSDQHVTSSLKSLRKSQSHASFLSPIIRLVRYPVTTIESALETLWAPGEHNAQDKLALDMENRRQVLLQRLKDVRAESPIETLKR
jgi:hypothetical protein